MYRTRNGHNVHLTVNVTYKLGKIIEAVRLLGHNFTMPPELEQSTIMLESVGLEPEGKLLRLYPRIIS